MSCDVIQFEDLVLYFDGELPGDEARLVEDHLKSCATCRGQAIEYARVDRMLDQLDEPIVPDDFVQRTVARQTLPRRVVNLVFTQVVSAAAVLLICLLGAFVLVNSRKPPQPAPAVVMNMELLENMEVVRDIELLKEFDPSSRTGTDTPEPDRP